MHKAQDKPENAKEVLKFFDWSLNNGGKIATDLDYVPMPASVVKLINTAWKNDIKATDGKAVW
jgi:phosphate transport system substrate-binding protein